MATINMIVGQKVILAAIKTKNGIDAEVVGIPTWTPANPAIVDVDPAVDGLTCEVTAKTTGATTVTCNAQGASPLSANHTISVAASSTVLATALSISVQSPPS